MAISEEFVPRAQDRIVFLGDSITQQQLYTNYAESYLAARYPELELTFFNAGWGGDTATGGLKRLERDVLALRPTLVSICYGANDTKHPGSIEEVVAVFLDSMRRLTARLKDAGARVVLLTPGMSDEHSVPGLAAMPYNNRRLRVMADAVLRLADEERLPAADIHKLMNDVNDSARAADPTFTMIPDGVHPDPAGHLVMAYGLLQALGVPPRQQLIEVDAGSGTASASDGVRVSNVESTRHGVSLDVQLDRLPFYVEHDARKVLPHLPFQETYNSLTLKVCGLAAPNACFRTPTLRTAARPRGDFETGINLFSQWNVGPMLRAQAVHRFTFEKQTVYFRLWRALGVFDRIDFEGEAPAFRAGIDMVPALDRARDQLLAAQARSFNLHVLATDEPGEPLQNGEFISQWSCLGPFPKPFEDDRLGGEAAFSAQPAPCGPGWQPLELDLTAPGNNLAAALGPHEQCFAYAVTVITSPVEQEAELLVGSDDGVGVWLNGEALFSNLNVARGVLPDQDRIPVRLRAGENVLLLKITQLAGAWGFCARFADLHRSVIALPPTMRQEA